MQHGVEEASKVYEQFVKTFKDPMLYFYAADYSVHAEQIHRIGKLLNEAVELFKRMPGKYNEELKHRIESYKEKMYHPR